MKIVSLQLSNILSFQYIDDIGSAPKINFDDDLNIIIGENGSGKSTALEVINFLFKRVIYKQYNFNQELYARRNTVTAEDRRQTLQPVNSNNYNGMRLDANWNTEDKSQTIRIVLKLDAIDRANIAHLQASIQKLNDSVGYYSTRGPTGQSGVSETYILDVTLNRRDQNFSVAFKDCAQDFGYEYLSDYHYYKESIALYNFEHPDQPIAALYESFTLISSYRNYHAFNISVSLKDSHPAQQIQQMRSADYKRSLNANDNSEPSIFGIVRLRVAERHFDLISGKMDEAECEAAANDLQFIKEINNRLKVVNLSCKIRLLDKRTWQYSFEFYDLRRGKAITDINSLSAGQKAITHLVFEAYGRGDLKGGLVIIDEPEIHLHYQFQHEYLQVIRELNAHQSCQYILVTHSEALINSSTINSVRRFSLNAAGYTEIRSPQLSTDQKVLIRILDNTRSTYAFFAKKVVLVEGPTDRYFFKAVIQAQHQHLDQEIAILLVAGKGEFPEWTKLFEAFGLQVYRIADLDYTYNLFYTGESKAKLNDAVAVTAFKAAHPDCDARIAAEYSNGTFILKNGDLERYLNIDKDLSAVISFCNNDLARFLLDNSNPSSVEVRDIVQQVAS